MKSGRPSGAVSVDGRRLRTLGARADRVLISVEEDLPVRVLPLEVRDLGKNVLEGRALIVRVDPQMNGLLGFFWPMTC